MNKKQNTSQKRYANNTHNKKHTAKNRSDKREPNGKLSLCPVFERCGGCQLLDVPYEKQLVLKQHYVEQLFNEAFNEASQQTLNKESEELRLEATQPSLDEESGELCSEATQPSLRSPDSSKDTKELCSEATQPSMDKESEELCSEATQPSFRFSDSYSKLYEFRSSDFCSESGKMHSILGMSNPFYYRNKVISPFVASHKAPSKSHTDIHKSGNVHKSAVKNTNKNKHVGDRPEILTGLYARGTHKLVPTTTCMLENEIAKEVILAVRDLMMRWDIAPYNESTGTGFMRHAVVRVGHASNEVLVTLVTNVDKFPSSKSFCRELVRRVPAVTSVVQNVNKQQTNVILGDHENTLYGPGFILDTLCGLKFRISSQSFYQVNAVQAEVLYNAAIELGDLSGNETVIDAYCGTGTIGLVAASCGAQRLYGVDNVASAINDARENAKHNGITHAEFVVGDAEDFMRNFADYCDTPSENLVVVMDPPRAGTSESFLNAIAQLHPSRVVYISCNPKTQVRDVTYLMQTGYQITAIQPVDMFPHTEHVECIVALCR